MLRVEVKKNHIVMKADGFTDLANYCDTTRDKRRGSASSTDREDWYQTSSFTDATDLLVRGWTDGASKVDSIRDTVRQRVGTIDGTQFHFDHAMYGTRLDVSAYSVGSPLALLQAYEEPERRKTRFVRILVDTCFSWSVKAEDILTRGAAIVALCDSLNALGYSTEVWAVANVSATSQRKTGLVSTLVPVQGVGEPWDTRSAMFPLAHASFLRRMVFAVLESQPEDVRKLFGAYEHQGYGVPTASTKGSLADIHCGGADLICESHAGSISDVVRDPVAWVLKQCRNLGVITEEEMG